ncbi:MAG: hypothetical protein ACRELB_24815 [Polyangiaceae bacterium]
MSRAPRLTAAPPSSMLSPHMDLAKAKASGKKWLLRILVGGLLLLVGGSALYTLFTLKYSYSAGERVGFVQKLSKKGWLCKTNEGELAQINFSGQNAQMFYFSVRDDAVVKQIDDLAGRKVVLDYEEHRGVPSSCFGDTEYYVVAVHEAK